MAIESITTQHPEPATLDTETGFLCYSSETHREIAAGLPLAALANLIQRRLTEEAQALAHLSTLASMGANSLPDNTDNDETAAALHCLKLALDTNAPIEEFGGYFEALIARLNEAAA